jgi:NADPH:quinone reductase-like Zn-dependent oxidoreductase
MGAHITGVSSASNLELVASLGADEVVDYTKEDFTENHQKYDVVFDAVGKTTAKRAKRVLSVRGRFVTTQARLRERVETLQTVRDMLARGSIEAVIDRCYTLRQISEAHRYVEEGHKRGNVVVVMAQG